MIHYAKYVLAPLFILTVFTSCDETEYEDVRFTTEYVVNLKADTDTTAGSSKNYSAWFSVLDSIKPMEDENFKEYNNKIKEIRIREIAGSISSINMPTEITTAQISFFADTNLASWNLSNESLMKGTVLKLLNFNDQYEEVVDLLHEKETMFVRFEGETSKENVVFNLELTLVADITADPY